MRENIFFCFDLERKDFVNGYTFKPFILTHTVHMPSDEDIKLYIFTVSLFNHCYFSSLLCYINMGFKVPWNQQKPAFLLIKLKNKGITNKCFTRREELEERQVLL